MFTIDVKDELPASLARAPAPAPSAPAAVTAQPPRELDAREGAITLFPFLNHI